MPVHVVAPRKVDKPARSRQAVLFLCLALVFHLTLGSLYSPLAAAATTPSPPDLSAYAYVLMDQDSGRVLVSRRPYERREPASLTKVMTALVALEQASIEKTLTVSTRAAGVGGAVAGLGPGQKLELWVGLYGLLFLSGNDAARAIAENIGGSESDFAKLMNSRAHRIGADNTQFVNPHGLSAVGHYSTAFDLALIAREALKNQTLARIVGRTTRTLPWRGGTRSLSNINKFMYRYSGATGVKTGYTAAAGYCLAAAATRDGRRLLAILLGAPSSEARWQDAIRIMDYGFANFTALLKNAPSRPSVAGNGAGGVGGAGSAAIPAGAHPYRVCQGDTIYSLAKRAGIDIATILKLNPGLDPDHIRVGQQLALPGAPTD